MQVTRMGCLVAVFIAIGTPGCMRDISVEPETQLEILKKTGRRHHEVGRYNEEAEAYLEMLAMGDMRASTENDAGYALWCAGNPERALPHLKAATRRSPANLRYSNNFATVLVDLGRDAEAFEVMHNAHAVLEHIHFNMAYLYSKRNRNQEAIEHLEKAIELKPDFARANELLDELSRVDTAEDR